MKVKIYCLYDPMTSKIRYIGRTKREIRVRLNEHICNAKKQGKNKYLYTWIRSLLKNGIRPKIKQLTIVEGWEESHNLERFLINKYKDKFKLTNMEDRGEGGLNKTFSKETKEKQIESLKKYYSKEDNKKNFYSEIFCYDLKGFFVKSYKSSIFAAKELNIKRSVLANHINRFDNHNLKVNSLNGYYFSKNKLKYYPISEKYQSNYKTVEVFKDEKLFKKFETIKDFIQYFNLSSWDITQLNRGVKTKKYKRLEKNYVIKRPT